MQLLLIFIFIIYLDDWSLKLFMFNVALFELKYLILKTPTLSDIRTDALQKNFNWNADTSPDSQGHLLHIIFDFLFLFMGLGLRQASLAIHTFPLELKDKLLLFHKKYFKLKRESFRVQYLSVKRIRNYELQYVSLIKKHEKVYY